MTEKRAILQLDITDYCIDQMELSQKKHDLLKGHEKEENFEILKEWIESGYEDSRDFFKAHLLKEIDKKITEKLFEYSESRLGKSTGKKRKTDSYL